MSGISRLLIANRGEIACRVIRTARKMGVETVAVFSEADRHAQHVAMADRSVCIGPAPALQSYLRADRILEAAQRTRAEAVHPGYGFLSESAEFAEQCAAAGLVFVGPPASAIRDMGLKSRSKAIMEAAGVPVVQGYHGVEQEPEQLLERARAIGFPVMIKAVRGGGGKGMRIALQEDVFLEQLAAAKREARKSFNDEVMLVERYIQRPRHVEVQVFGDTHGNCVHLFERDCSVQRRHQKVLEEAGAPGLSVATRHELGAAAVRAAQAVGYVGAGTVEFIMDAGSGAAQDFFFMEMNTRLQVEHPVTEMVTGRDLVEWQLRVAAGEQLPATQDELSVRGHAFEARVYAEDTSGGRFMPTAGRVARLDTPAEVDGALRVETGVVAGDEIGVHYDPMIAKLVVWGEDRDAALRRLRHALQRFRVAGLATNLGFLRALAAHPALVSGDVHTDFIEEHSAALLAPEGATEAPGDVAAAAVAWRLKEGATLGGEGFRVNLPQQRSVRLVLTEGGAPQEVLVTKEASSAQLQRYQAAVPGAAPVSVSCTALNPQEQTTALEVDGQLVHGVRLVPLSASELELLGGSGGAEQQLRSARAPPAFLRKLQEGGAGGGARTGAVAASPMPGVVEKLLVAVGDNVTANQPLATLMAMKMELVVRAGRDGVVAAVMVREGATVAKGQLLVALEKSAADEQEED